MKKQNFLRILILAAVPLAAYFYPFAFSGPVFCAFRRLTGIPCPGCGMTRAFACIAHGRILDSLTYNAFGIVLFSGILVLLSVSFWDLLRGTDHFRHIVYNRKTGWALLIIFISYGTCRLIWFFAAGGIHDVRRDSWILHGVEWLKTIFHRGR